MFRRSVVAVLVGTLVALALAACETEGAGDVPDAPQADASADVSVDVPLPPDATDAAVDLGADVPEPQDVPVDPGPDVPDPSDAAEAEPPDAADIAADIAADPGVDLPADLVGDAEPDATPVSCGGEDPFFPAFPKACADDEGCALGVHQVDCCGNRVALGLSADQKAAFDAAEATCEAQYPKCGCPQGPIVADDGQGAFEATDLRVACVEGACLTHVDPCALVKPFEWQNACATDDDCALAFHQINCCGTLVAWGVSADQAGAFAAAEAACEASYPHCGCASKPTEAQDGNTGLGPETFGVACQQGGCRSHVLGEDPRCHTPYDCPDNQMCLAPGEAMPCGMCYEPENTCASDPDCPEGTVCELVTAGCVCYAATQCVPACNLPASLACAPGQTCSDAGHCVDTPCANDADCPEFFACATFEDPVCRRKTCGGDLDCGWGRCVQGACYAELGSCSFLPP